VLYHQAILSCNDAHLENSSFNIYICSYSCFFFFPPAVDAEFLLVTQSKLEDFILPYYLSQSSINDILGPKYPHAPAFLCSSWNQTNSVAFG